MSTNTFNFSASFASQASKGTSKREMKRQAEGPGPGQYGEADRAMRPDLRELRSELQYFGSTVERFKKAPGEVSALPDSLGPGSYVAKGSVRIGPPNARGFCATQERFKGDDAKSSSVGPGQYQLAGMTDDNMSGPLATFSMLGNSGGLAFGTMNKRFTYPPEDGRPGPGSYGAPNSMTDNIVDESTLGPEDSESKGKSRKKLWKASRLPGSSFASRTPKDVHTLTMVKEGLQKPPPGAYDPVLVKDQATVVRLRSKSEGFLSGGERFQGGPLAAPKGYHMVVGPGKYSPQNVSGGKRMGTFNRSMIEGMPEGGRPKGLGFDGQDKRFKTSTNAKHPGPGQYNTDPGWISKSFNCYFGDLT
jgi:hypothetical protein